MAQGRRDWIWIAMAVAVRAAAVLALQSHTVPRSTYEHGEIAASLLAGRGFSVRFLGAEGPTSQQAPVYPMIVAGAYALGGVATPRALLILELGQAALGGVLVAGVLRLARQVAPGRPTVAGASALIAACHPTLVYAATHVQVASLAATLLVWTLVFAGKLAVTASRRDGFAFGLTLAALVLTDPILGLVAPAAAWAIVRGRGGLRAAARPLATVALIATLGVMPWIARNYKVHGELVLVKSSFGYAFWQGNCAGSLGTDKVARASVERVLARGGGGNGLAGLNKKLWEARHEAGYIDDVLLTRADYRKLGSVAEPERSRILFRRALADLRAEPGRYRRLCLARLQAFVFFDETNPKTRSLIYRVGHLGLTGLAVAGLLLAPGVVRARLGPSVVAATLIAAFHAATIVSARFHIPIEPLLAVWAASGLARWPLPEVGSAPSADHVEGVGIIRRLRPGGVVAGRDRVGGPIA